MLSTGESSKPAVSKLSCRVAVSAAYGTGEACSGLAWAAAGPQSRGAGTGCASASNCVAGVRSTGCAQAGPLLRHPEGWPIKLACPLALRLGGVRAFCVNVSTSAASSLRLEDSCRFSASFAEGRNSCASRVLACGWAAGLGALGRLRVCCASAIGAAAARVACCAPDALLGGLCRGGAATGRAGGGRAGGAAWRCFAGNSAVNGSVSDDTPGLRRTHASCTPQLD